MIVKCANTDQLIGHYQGPTPSMGQSILVGPTDITCSVSSVYGGVIYVLVSQK